MIQLQHNEKIQRNKSSFCYRTMGIGVKLVGDPEMLQNVEEPQLVQEYVPNPYLLDDLLKFDLLVYVVVKSLNPLSIWICREGMVRFATVQYRAPSQENFQQTNMHLTNFTLNRYHPGCVLNRVTFF